MSSLNIKATRKHLENELHRLCPSLVTREEDTHFDPMGEKEPEPFSLYYCEGRHVATWSNGSAVLFDLPNVFYALLACEGSNA